MPLSADRNLRYPLEAQGLGNCSVHSDPLCTRDRGGTCSVYFAATPESNWRAIIRWTILTVAGTTRAYARILPATGK